MLDRQSIVSDVESVVGVPKNPHAVTIARSGIGVVDHQIVVVEPVALPTEEHIFQVPQLRTVIAIGRGERFSCGKEVGVEWRARRVDNLGRSLFQSVSGKR